MQRGLVAQHKAYIESDGMLFEIYGAFVYWPIRWPPGCTSPTDTNGLLPVFPVLELFFLRHIPPLRLQGRLLLLLLLQTAALDHEDETVCYSAGSQQA